MNPAKKARELLKASRSKADFTKTDVHNEPVNIDTNQLNQGNSEKTNVMVEDSHNHDQHEIHVQKDLREELIEKSLNIETSDIHPVPHKDAISVHQDNQNKIHNEHTTMFPKEVKPKLNDRLAMFENKNKQNDKPITPSSGIAGNKFGLLNRMNKDKEPTKVIGVKPSEENKHENLPNSNVEPVKTEEKVIDITDKENVEEVPKIEIPQTKAEDKEKLMKRITSAKSMSKGLSQDKQLGKKTSERIMGIASMLQNKMQGGNDQEKELNKLLGTEVPKKKFFLNDNDIQRLDDNKIKEEIQINPMIFQIHAHSNVDYHPTSEKLHYEKKDPVDILMEKPTNKNTRKRAKQTFLLKEECLTDIMVNQREFQY